MKTTRRRDWRINPAALQRCRDRGRCELNWGPEICFSPGDHAHHVIPRGHGGARRLDVDIGLILVCGHHHRKVHADRRGMDPVVIGRVCRREGCSPEDWREAVRFLLSLPKRPLAAAAAAATAGLAALTAGARGLVERELREARVIC